MTLSAVDPAATSTTIAQTYGFAASLAVPVVPQAYYQSINPHPDVVAAVTPVGAIRPSGEYRGRVVDTYA